MKRMAMRMRIDKNYYSIMIKYPEDDGTCFSLQTRFDKCGDAVKYAQLIASNYLKELDLRVGWYVRYHFRIDGGGWSSRIVVDDTELVDLSIIKEGKK